MAPRYQEHMELSETWRNKARQGRPLSEHDRLSELPVQAQGPAYASDRAKLWPQVGPQGARVPTFAAFVEDSCDLPWLARGRLCLIVQRLRERCMPCRWHRFLPPAGEFICQPHWGRFPFPLPKLCKARSCHLRCEVFYEEAPHISAGRA